MFDTMTTTKIIGAFCGSLLVFLLGSWAAESIYSMGGGHGGEEHASYVIEVEGDDSHAEVVEEDAGPDIAELIANADLAKGAKVYGKCKACHKLGEGENATGPTLFGIVDRPVASIAGFGYSGKLIAVAQTWDAQTLSAFLTKPKKFAPGTKMSFSGLKKPQDRANLIAYLDSVK